MRDLRKNGGKGPPRGVETHRQHAITVTPLRYDRGGWHGTSRIQPLEGNGPHVVLKVQGPFDTEDAARQAALTKARDVVDRLLV